MKKLALVLCLVLLLTESSLTNAQPQTTSNLINPTGWQGLYYTNSAGVSYCCQGGPGPAMNQDTNTIRFSYAYMPTSQIIAINSALFNNGVNVQVTGFNYSFQLYNNLSNYGDTRGNLMAAAMVASPTYQILQQWNQDYSQVNTGPNFVQESGTVNFNTSYSLSQIGYAGVAFIGSDLNYWAGYYGPRVRDPSFSLNFTAGPAAPAAPVQPVTTSTTPTATTIAQQAANAAASTVAAATTGSTASAASTAAAAATGITAAAGSTDTSSANQSSLNAGGVMVSTSGGISAPTGLSQNVSDALSSATSSAAASTSSATSTAATTTTTPAAVAATAAATATATSSTSTTTTSTSTSTAPAVASTSQKESGGKGVSAATMAAVSQAQAQQKAQLAQVQKENEKASATRMTAVAAQSSAVVSTIQTQNAASAQASSQDNSQSSQTVNAVASSTSSTTSSDQSTGISAVTISAVKMQSSSNKTSDVAKMNMVSTTTSTVASSSLPVAPKQQTDTVNLDTDVKPQSSFKLVEAVKENKAQVQSFVYVDTSSSMPVAPKPQVATTNTVQQVQPQTMENKPANKTVVATYTPPVNNFSIIPLSPIKLNAMSQQKVQDSIQTYVETNTKFNQQVAKNDAQLKAMQTELVIPQPKSYVVGKPNFTMDSSQQKLDDIDAQRNVAIETVKQNVANNDVAGKVSVEAMAVQPKGYQTYFVTLADVAFYEPKEVYKNQANVENAKALRGLMRGSDALHQEMVDQQYK